MELVTMQVPAKAGIWSEAKEVKAHHLSNLGMAIAAVAVAPLIAFALLWSAVLAALGGMWLLSVLGLI